MRKVLKIINDVVYYRLRKLLAIKSLNSGSPFTIKELDDLVKYVLNGVNTK